MDQEERESMLTVLRPLARKLGPLGREAYRWPSLQSHLTRFDGQYLKQNSTTILELFLDCLDNSAPPSTVSANSYRETTPHNATLGTSSAIPSTSAIDNDASSFNKVDDGFIQTTNLRGARFSYSDREDNLVGFHILKRYDLVSEIKNNRIILTFFLQPRPKRSYKLEFKIKKKASFDVQLGSKWEDEGEELEEKFTRIKSRPNQTQMARNVSTGVEYPPPFVPADYAGEFGASMLRNLWGGVSAVGLVPERALLESEAGTTSHFSAPLPIARTEAGTRGARRGSKLERVASPLPFESNSSYEGKSNKTSRLNTRSKQDEQSSYASTSATDLSDGFDNDHEDERDKYSESSAPELEDDSRECGIDDSGKNKLPWLSADLEKECLENVWTDDFG